MLNALPSIRPDERRAMAQSFLTLLLIMASHALLETARDTFFLSRLPATQLPWVYLLIAAASLIISALRQRGGRRGRRTDLPSFLVLAAMVNVLFLLALGRWGTPAVFALYVWSGVFSTLAVVQFWNVVNAAFTVVQAKRLFAWIGVGGVVGAIVGSAVAGGLSAMLPPTALIVAASVAAALSAGAAAVLCRLVDDVDDDDAAPSDITSESFWAPLKQVRSSPYLVRLGLIVWLSAAGLTLADFVFKDAVARSVPAEQLGTFFSSTYLALNALSLGIQLFVVNWLMRSFGVSPLLAVLPVLASVGAVAVAAGGGLVAALGMKGADGMLRYSLHRTVVEVLYVPLSASLRSRVKELLDVVGQRGGQAVASIAILGLAAIGAEGWVVALALAAFVAWIMLALELRPHYLDLFRERIEASALASRMALPSLDLASLEALMGALNSSSDDEVVAAMDLLAEQGRASLIPALILYHPSATVVRRALRVFADAGRTDFLPIAERLVGHLDPEVRASVLRVRTTSLEDVEPLRDALQDPATIVRATAVAGLAAARGCGDEDVALTLDDVLSRGSADARLALARAIGDRPDPVCAWILVKLGDDGDDRVRRAAARSMRSLPADAEYVGSLVRMLGKRSLRPDARATLVAMGDVSVEPLREALDDPTLDRAVRLHLPRTVSLFEPQAAADLLMSRLRSEPDGAIKFKLIRGLGMLKDREPDVRLSDEVLASEIDQTLDEACRFLGFRTELNLSIENEPESDHRALRLLAGVFGERERYAVDRLFRFLHLRDANDDFWHIYRGLRSDQARVRASSRELMDNRLDPEIRSRMMVLLDDTSDRERAVEIARLGREQTRGKDNILRWVLSNGGITLKLIALYYIGETKARSLTTAVESCHTMDDQELEHERRRVLASLSGSLAEGGVG